MKDKRTAAIVIIISLVIALGVGGLYWRFLAPARQPPPAAGPMEQLTIGVAPGIVAALLWIAQERGYFREHGLDAAIKIYQVGLFALEDLAAGHIDLAVCADFTLVRKILAGGEHLRFLGTIAAADLKDEILVRKDRGINQPRDLRGKKIGVTRSTSGEFFLKRFLTYQGISLEEVEVVDLPPLEMEDALRQGKVDAVITWDPARYRIKTQMADNLRYWPAQGGQDQYMMLVSTEQVIKAKAPAMERLFRGLAQADSLVKQRPGEARATVGQRLQLDPDYVNRVWPEARYTLSCDQALLPAMEDAARWLMDSQPTDKKQVPNFLDYLNVEFLSRTKPDGIKLMSPR